jgi:CheY-like chemotaxis protein
MSSNPERPLILVVDDEPDNLEIVVAYLEHHGYSTRTAGGGRLAVELARQLRPELILMDLMMPDLGGVEALRLIRSDPACESIPFVAFTADVQYTPARAQADGFCGLVYKPILPSNLTDAVGRCLAAARAGARWTDLPVYAASP